MSLSYNIDKLLQVDDDSSQIDDKSNSEVSDQSFSDNEEEHSDVYKSDLTPYIRKFKRRNKSGAPDDVRLRVNSRERQRMHDLNAAMDSLRQVMPYSQGPSVKKISKMATLLLARNYIVTLNKSLDEMRKMVNELTHKQASPVHRASTSVTVGMDNLHRPSAGHIPLYPQTLPPSSNYVYGADYFRVPFPAAHHVSPPYAPLNLVCPQKSDINGAHSTSTPCPCNFCQTSLASLPKPKWKQAC